MGVISPVHPQQETGETDRRHRKKIGDRCGQRPPHQDGKSVDRHSRCAATQQRDNKIRRANNCGDAEENQSQRIDVDVDARIVLQLGVGNVVEPSSVRRLTQGKTYVEKDAREKIDPIAQRIEAWKRHVARAEQQRPEIIRKSRQHRQRVKKDHRDAVHREKLIVGFGRQQFQARLSQLNPHRERFNAADDQKEERGAQIADPDLLVIDGCEPTVEAGRSLPDIEEFSALAAGQTLSYLDCHYFRPSR